MTGIKRLRRLASARDERVLGEVLADIADEIERERDAEVADSPYDAILPEDRDAIAWVREHGGIGCVQTMAATLGDTLSWIRERAGLSKYELADYDELLEALDRRLMPEGYEWPRYESGEPLRYEDRYVYDGREREVWHVDFDSCGEPTILNKDGTRSHPDKGERVERPAVLAADGEPLEVGQTVWTLDSPSFECGVIGFGNGMVHLKSGADHLLQREPSDLTHRRPVLDADGVPIKVGDTVYFTDGREQECNTVVHAKYDYKDEPYVQFGRLNEAGYPTYTNCSCIDPSQLTHERPDTWERLEEDAEKNPFDYCKDVGHRLDTCENAERFKANDIVRRCKALAERGK